MDCLAQSQFLSLIVCSNLKSTKFFTFLFFFTRNFTLARKLSRKLTDWLWFLQAILFLSFRRICPWLFCFRKLTLDYLSKGPNWPKGVKLWTDGQTGYYFWVWISIFSLLLILSIKTHHQIFFTSLIFFYSRVKFWSLFLSIHCTLLFGRMRKVNTFYTPWNHLVSPFIHTCK